MSRKPAMRVRMDLAKAIDPTDFTSVGDVAKSLEEIKDFIKSKGFVMTDDVSARLGSFDFGGDDPAATSEPETAKGS